QQRRPRSVLCTAFASKGRLLAVLYMENDLIPGAFTEERVEVLQMLSSQIAISIENALLYREIEAAERSGARDVPGPAAPDDPQICVGARVRQYEVIRTLGQGGMSEVFLAHDTRLGRLVAIKLLLPHISDQAQRFLIEARATAQLVHENIVVIHELGE